MDARTGNGFARLRLRIDPARVRGLVETVNDGILAVSGFSQGLSGGDAVRNLASPIVLLAAVAGALSVASIALASTLADRDAEQVAAAFLRQYRAGHSAPEELQDVPAEGERRKPRRDDFPVTPRDEGSSGGRNDFTDGVWVSLSVGRKQNAEPRWLIPMLCRNGNLTKRDIGAIKMQPEETFVELAPEGAERFLSAIGPDKTL